MSEDIQQLLPNDYPPLLREIPNYPLKMFIRGKIPPLNFKYLTVVGSRKYSPYGKQVCEHLIRGLTNYPIVIVSGLAIGIDTIAHKSAIDANLHTIAIPGSGLDDSILYPRTNVSLALEILKSNGALVSEYEPKFRATKWSFPQRNRIMAGISNATLLIEAANLSGSLITARLATEYNRELLVVPNSIFSENGKGVHQFLKLGAIPVTDSEDIVRALGIDFEEKQDKIFRKNISLEENLVLENLNNPMVRDELIRALSMETSSANMLLSKMELSGLIVEEMGLIRVA
jgi:DNA processing protein